MEPAEKDVGDTAFLLERTMQARRRVIRELQLHQVPVQVIGNMKEEEQNFALEKLNASSPIEARAFLNALVKKFEDR